MSASCPQTPYFLITDSDTFFVNKWQALDLMMQRPCNASSGVCNLKKKVPSRCLLPGPHAGTALKVMHGVWRSCTVSEGRLCLQRCLVA